jgi:hypothetical protein
MTTSKPFSATPANQELPETSQAASPPEPPAGADGERVGRNSPPKEHRFQKGRSGNPGGRKKGSLNLKSVVREVAETPITLTENGQRQTVSIMFGIVLRVAQQALQGDLRAAAIFLDLGGRCLPEPANEEVDLSAEDLALIYQGLQRREPPCEATGAMQPQESAGSASPQEAGDDGP